MKSSNEHQSRSVMRGVRYTALGTSALALACATACGAAPEGVPEAVVSTSQALTATEILGFEALGGWTPQSGTKSLSTDRSRGASALALNGLSGYVNVVSGALSSQALPGLGVGSQLSLDVKLPAPPPNQYWNGAIQMYLSVPSKNLFNVYLGQVELTPLPKSKYVTLHFNVPETAGTALAGTTFNDLTFTVAMNVPNGSNGTYRLDNLRLRGAFPTGGVEDVKPGESILMKAWKGSGTDNRVEDLTFSEAIIQIPERFRVVEGNAGSGALKFEYQPPGGTLARCDYAGDSASGGTYYKLSSCTGGRQAGDLVLATRAKLTITSGSSQGPRTKVRAQIAKNPLGDELGSIAPIPTYFGETAAELSSILTGYASAQQGWPLTSAKLIRVPTPDVPFASVHSGRNSPLPIVQPGHADPPFDFEWRLTGTDIVDTIWSSNGHLDVVRVSDTERRSEIESDVDVTFVALGTEQSLVRFEAFASATFTKQPDGSTNVLGQYELCPFVMDEGRECARGQSSVSIPLTIASYHEEWTVLPPQPFSVFQISANGYLDAELTAQLNFIPDGFGLQLTPSIGAGANLHAGAAIGSFLGGGVDGNLDLIHLAIPTRLELTTVEERSPHICALDNKMTFLMDANVQAAGGTVRYYLQGGLTCGYWDDLCWREEGELFEPVKPVQDTFNLFEEALNSGIEDIPLDPDLCPTGIILEVSDPEEGQKFPPGQEIWVRWDAFRDLGGGNQEVIACKDAHITSSDPNDIIEAADPDAPPTSTCFRKVTLSETPGIHTISNVVFDTVGTSPIVARQVEVVAPGEGEPPIVHATTDHPLIDCKGNGSAILTGTFVAGYPVHTWWFRGNTLIPGSENLRSLEVFDGGVYWYMVADANDHEPWSLSSVTIKYHCVK